MAASVGNLFVRMGLKANEYYRGMAQVTSTTLKTERQLLNLKRVAVAAFTGWGLQRLASNFVEAATTAEGYQVRLTGLLGSVEEGNKLFAAMNQYAAQTPFEFEKIMGAATALSGVMRGGVDEISKWMPMIGDLAAASGLTIEQTTQQVIRMYSAGAGAADLFRERGVLAMMGFQAGATYSAEQTRDIMMKAWTETGSKFAGMTDKLKGTWAGTMSMFSDHWFQFRNAVMQSGPFQAMKEQAQLLLQYINKIKAEGKLDEWAKQTGVVVIKVFSAATYAVQTFWNAFRWGEFIIAAVIETVTGKILEFLGPLRGMLGILDGWIEGLEHIQNATEMWATDTAGKIAETQTFFEGLRQILDDITTSEYKNVEAVVEGNARKLESHMETSAIIGESRQAFMNEEMERQLLLQMHEAGILKKRQQKFKWFTDFQAQYEKAKAQQRLKTNQEYFKLIAEALGKHGKLAFRAYQALAIAETVMSTVQAAQDAYAWGWQYGGPAAPVLSVAMAAIAVAAGMARVAQIASEKFEYATGGWVTGGSGVTDDVLIGMTGRSAHMATGGEFVVNREAAAENAALLEAINAGEDIGGGITIPITLELDGEILWSKTYRATREGDLQIHEGAVVAR